MQTAIFEDVRHDVRHTLRMLRANPAFTAIAILILAVGIGATAAIFSVVNATLLRPLPFREPERLMSVFLRMPVQFGAGEIDMVWSYPKYQVFLANNRAFSETAIHVADAFTVAGDDGAEHVLGESVSARYFQILGIQPQRGRFFQDAEDRPTGGDRSIVISDAYWRDRFGASEQAVGSTLDVFGQRYTIIGVAPPGFAGMTGNARIWPLFTAVRGLSTLQGVRTHQFEVVARLAPNVTSDAAKAAMADVGRIIDATYPPDGEPAWRATAYTLQELRVDPMVGQSVIVLAVAVSLLLLIACVNVANLLLARSAARRRELAVRLAIGAGQGRLVRQLLTESVILSGLGVVAGLVLAAFAVRALSATAPLAAANLSTVRGTLTAISLGSIALDGRAILVAVVVALLTGLVAGFVPAIAAARLPVADAMRTGAVATPTFTGLRRLTSRGALVMAEIALAVVLLVTSGLMVRSLSRLFDAQVGYRPDGVLTARVSLASGRPAGQPVGPLWDEIVQRVAALPGVTSVAAGSCAPVGDHCEGTSIRVAGRTEDAHVSFHVVSPNYFATLGIPMVRGREFTGDDRRESQPVMVINSTAARTIWGADDPLTTPSPRGEQTIHVVGVAGDVRYEDIEAEPKPAVFFPLAQWNRSRAMLFVRTTGDPAMLGAAVPREVRAVNRNHTVSEIATLRERMFDATARNRFATRVLSTFALTALLLAAIGIYGVLSLAVAQRRRELGIRMALGAEQRGVLKMILGQALSIAAAGGIIGAVGALFAGRAMRSMLYGVTAADPATYLVCAVVLGLAVLAAAIVPALRATQVHPMVALRSE
ncbi:MAG TPA: ABC transporter permease [Gemmatimonadaceae bacterium]|jgi:predicted permease|nr:ABC transporter permease [Gemmatimonadaceae bacterium]